MLDIDRKKELNFSKLLGFPVCLRGVGDSNLLITLHSVSAPDKQIFIKARESNISEFPENWRLEVADAPKLVRPPVISFRFLSYVSKILSYVLLGTVLTLGVANTLDVLQVRIVATGSMIPAIDPGDMVIGVNPAFRSAVVNDVVIYQARRFDNEEVAKFAHRIIGGDSISGFILKGDNNPEPDIQSVMPEDISSVIVVTIPKVGMVLNPQMIIYALMALVAMFIAWEFLRSED